MEQVLSYHPGAAAGSILSFILTQKPSLSSQANEFPVTKQRTCIKTNFGSRQL